MKKIAILGSSGGNLYSLGGKEPQKLIGEIVKQAEAADIQIAAVQFIGANNTMDNVSEKTLARVYQWDETTGEVVFSEEKKLSEINILAQEMDKQIAEMINNEEIDGMVLVSCDPKGTNKNAIEASTMKKIPLVGTGGTSMAMVQSMGGKVISTSGTTGTTNRTRAVAAIQSLSKTWGMKYKPIIGSTSNSTQNMEESILKRISFRGIMMAALPAFIAMALTLALSKVPGFSGLEAVFNLLINGLPIIVAAVAAKQVSGLDEIGIVAGVVAGVLSTGGGLIGGIIGGVLAGIFAFYLLRLTLSWNFPSTTANIVAGGFSGLIAGLLVFFLIAPLALALGNGVRSLIEIAIEYNAILAGAVAGFLMWPAIIGGVYHAAILPIVLLEMEKTGASFLGAIDMTALVMVSAGITLANVVYPRQKSEAAIAAPGFLINVGFGTFVEAAYPFMFSDKIVFIGAMISGALSGVFVGLFNVRGTAYVPAITAPMLSNNSFGFAVSMLVALGAAFLFTIFANRLARQKKSKTL
jgi:fructose-specific phosphotransferase system IIC component